MRRIILSLSLLLMTLAASAATVTALRVNLLSGDPVMFLLAGNPEVSFSGNKLKVTDPSFPAGKWIEMEDVSHIDFAEVSGIDTSDASHGISVSYSFGEVKFSNIPAGSPIAVYSIDGRTLLQTKSEGEYTLTADTFGPGTFIIRVGDIATKINF